MPSSTASTFRLWDKKKWEQIISCFHRLAISTWSSYKAETPGFAINSTCFNFHKSLNETEADALSRFTHFVAKDNIKGTHISDCYDV